MKFLFKAKNISIKRSKTKLEFGLPIPNLEKFQSKSEISTLLLIQLLSDYLIKINQSKLRINLEDFKKRLINLDFFAIAVNEKLLPNIFSAMKSYNNSFIQMIIDKLLFRLFDLDENNIHWLIEN